MLHYKLLSDISIYQFTLLTVLKSPEYLIIDYDTQDKQEIVFYLNQNSDVIKTDIANLVEDFDSLTFKKENLDKMNALSKIDGMYEDKDTVLLMLELFEDSCDPKYLRVINNVPSFTYDEYEDEKTQLDKIRRGIKLLENKIRLAEKKYEDKYKIEEVEKIEEDEKSLYAELDKQAMNLSSNLELGHNLDVKKTNVVRWYNYIDANDKRAEYMESLKNKK